MSLTVTSTAFREGESIPPEYTCWGAGRIPPLAWTGVPENAHSIAVVVEDPDAPRGAFVHWLLYGVPATATQVAGAPPGAQEGANSAGRLGWYPPCPPSGTHRYVFTVHALRSGVATGDAATVLAQIERESVASGSLTGTVTARR